MSRWRTTTLPKCHCEARVLRAEAISRLRHWDCFAFGSQ